MIKTYAKYIQYKGSKCNNGQKLFSQYGMLILLICYVEEMLNSPCVFEDFQAPKEK